MAYGVKVNFRSREDLWVVEVTDELVEYGYKIRPRLFDTYEAADSFRKITYPKGRVVEYREPEADSAGFVPI